MNQRVGEFCSRHASPNLKRRCSEPGCAKQAHARGKCVRHGGGRLCKVPGCPKHVRQSGYCLNHWYSLRETTKLESKQSEPMSHDVPKQSIKHLLNDDIPATDFSWCAIPFRMPFVPN
ncbi:hypothetical protein AC1031_004073 [Aphanomyces cochlioides]|nr:hypothetical protein AC1031_004073 [Aphanomyces cochlioides]